MAKWQLEWLWLRGSMRTKRRKYLRYITLKRTAGGLRDVDCSEKDMNPGLYQSYACSPELWDDHSFGMLI